MAVTQTPLRAYQWGKESTRGTAVPATSPIFCNGINFVEKDRLIRPPLAKGVMMRNRGAETPVERWTEFEVPTFPLAFDQLCNWLSMAVAGGVTPAGPTDSAFTWSFSRQNTVNPVPDSWTLERRLTSGASPKDLEWAFALLSEFTIKGSRNGEVTFEASGFARRKQSSTMTAALTHEVGFIPVHAASRLYIDDTAGAGGSTIVSNQLLDWQVRFITGSFPLWTADNRADLDYSVAPVNGENAGFEFEATFLVDAQFSLEQLAAEAVDGSVTGGLRAIRLEVNHPTLIGASSTRRLRVDMISKSVPGSIFQVGTQDGQDVVTCRYQETPAATPYIKFEVVNDVPTLG